MDATLLAAAASKHRVMTPAEAPGKRPRKEVCFALCMKSKTKNMLGTFTEEKQSRSPREKNLCVLLLLTFLISVLNCRKDPQQELNFLAAQKTYL